MRLTIIPIDTYCSVDGVGYSNVDMSSIDFDIHAVQWFDVTGWIEYKERLDGTKPPNQTISSIEQFSPVIASWEEIDYSHKHPPEPPAPTPEQITSGTISTAVQNLQTIAYLTTSEMGQHITPESRQEVTDYIHAVANILATAQSKYGTGEAYAPTFPPMPTAMPQLGAGDDLPAPYIQFIVVN